MPCSPLLDTCALTEMNLTTPFLWQPNVSRKFPLSTTLDTQAVSCLSVTQEITCL
jgi:hypothetical protein